MEKYEFVTGDTVTIDGVVLTRIRALIDIASHGIKVGDLGGYIENELNLCPSGDCWVSGEARVSGGAQVFGNAFISGNTQLFGDACISGDAKIYTNKDICWFSSIDLSNGALTAYKTDNGIELTWGCFCGSIEEFMPQLNEEDQPKFQHLINFVQMQLK